MKKSEKLKLIMTQEEKTLRDDLALCHRILASEGITEGHLTLALDNPKNAFLSLPHGILWSSVLPTDFILHPFSDQKPSSSTFQQND